MTDIPQPLPIEIRNRWTNDVLYSSAKATTVSDAVIEAILIGTDLSGASLIRANLSGVNLSGANLSGVNLSGASLSRVNLSGASLRGADLSGVNLSVSDLSGANLRGAYLDGADLTGSNLMDTSLIGADLIGAIWGGARVLSFAQVTVSGRGECGRTLTAIQTEKETIIRCGGFSGSPDEFTVWIADDEQRFAKTRTLALDTALILLAAKNDEVGE